MEDIEYILPSEIARLVYGYLKLVKCDNVAEKLLTSSKHLTECLQFKNKNHSFNTNIYGLHLEDILNQFVAMNDLILDMANKLVNNDNEQYSDVEEALLFILQLKKYNYNHNKKLDLPVPVRDICQVSEKSVGEENLDVLHTTEMINHFKENCNNERNSDVLPTTLDTCQLQNHLCNTNVHDAIDQLSTMNKSILDAANKLVNNGHEKFSDAAKALLFILKSKESNYDHDKKLNLPSVLIENICQVNEESNDKKKLVMLNRDEVSHQISEKCNIEQNSDLFSITKDIFQPLSANTLTTTCTDIRSYVACPGIDITSPEKCSVQQNDDFIVIPSDENYIFNAGTVEQLYCNSKSIFIPNTMFTVKQDVSKDSSRKNKFVTIAPKPKDCLEKETGIRGSYSKFVEKGTNIPCKKRRTRVSKKI